MSLDGGLRFADPPYQEAVPQYRRARVPGGTFFFTVNLADRRRSLLVDRIDALWTAVRAVRVAHRFAIDAIVVMPDHLHAIWTLPSGDADFSGRWSWIKHEFTRLWLEGFGRETRLSVGRQRERPVHQEK